MNVKIFSLVATLIIMNFNSLTFAADSLSEQLGFQISGGASFILQATPKLNNKKEGTESANSATYSFDLIFRKDFKNDGRVLLNFAGGDGNGLSGENKLSTYSETNADVDKTVNSKGGYVKTKITKLFFEKPFFDSRLTVAFGKMGFFTYFANNNYAGDENKQFITGLFVKDPLIETPGQHVALRLNYIASEKVNIDYAYYTTRVDQFDAKGVNVLQTTYKAFKNGNYRIYVWKNNKEHFSFNSGNKSGIYGIGLSADQTINKKIGVFARVGYKKPSVGTKKNADKTSRDNFEFNLPTSLMWSLGTQFKSPCRLRMNDMVGLAIGQIYGSSKAKHANLGIDSNYKADAETQIELYYNFMLSKLITLTPILQCFIKPQGGNAKTNDKILIYGIKTYFNF
ncbi:MAG: carbohydrate porin [Endomicrobium sp.]|nr:carbohydrate porin [Endomicrobium sp.]